MASRSCSIACLVDINTKVALRPVRDYCAAVAQGGGCLFGCLAKDLNATAVVSRAASLAETSNRWATGSGPAWTTGDPSRHSHSIRLTPRAAVAPGQSNAHDASILSAMEPSPRLDHHRERHGPPRRQPSRTDANRPSDRSSQPMARSRDPGRAGRCASGSLVRRGHGRPGRRDRRGRARARRRSLSRGTSCPFQRSATAMNDGKLFAW